MEEKWVEHIKTVVLILLITLSFCLTGFLWFYSPGYQQKPINNMPPPVLTDDKTYNEKKSTQFVAPYQLIVNLGGRATWLHSDSEEYRTLVDGIKNAEITKFEAVNQVTPEEWKKRLLDGPSLQLQFPRDMNSETVDAFFKTSVLEKFSLHQPTDVSRILLHLSGGQPQLWLISDDAKTILQAQLQLDPTHLQQTMEQAVQHAQVELTPVVANGKAPWDKANEKQPWSRIFYLPTASAKLPVWRYKTEQIKIDDIKEYLLTSTDVEPIVIHDENLYMARSQRLVYNKRGSLQYTEDVPTSESTHPLVENQLYDVNNFVKRHRGWTGDYLLDRVERVKDERDTNQLTFRRIIAGLPVYWNRQDGQMIYPDVLQFQAGASGGEDGIKQYARSTVYMLEGTRDGEAMLPGRDEVLRQLSERKLALTAIKHIYPGYETNHNLKDKTVQFTPVWVVLTTAGEQFFIGSPTS
ncbi:hypothetical protein C1X05_16500 [Laceyella sacchari]|nr:hypothetical protein C1X05_16500 [Laceyella sacchari]